MYLNIRVITIRVNEEGPYIRNLSRGQLNMPVQCKTEVEFPGVLDIIWKNHMEFLALLHFKTHFFIDDSVAEFLAD